MVINEGRVIDKKSVQAKAFTGWAKRYRRDVLCMSYEAFGNYLAAFIKYLVYNYGELLTEKDVSECQERLSGKLTEMVRGFESEDRYSEKTMNKVWRRYFVLFCMTGDVRSTFNIFDYLDTGEMKLLPPEAWTRKEIPILSERKEKRQGASEDNNLKERIEALESQLAALLGGAKHVETSEKTIAFLLSEYIRGQMQDRGVERSAILNTLVARLNEQGANFVRMELELILDRVDNFCYLGRIRTILKRVSALEILLKEDGKPYTFAEMSAMPLGFDLIQEDQKLPRSR